MRLTLALAFALALTSCKREQRQLRDEPPRRAIFTAARESDLLPGGPVPQIDIKSPYEGNAYAISEGRRLFSWYNCAGCHAPNGGGGMGVPLTGEKFIFGKEPENIYDTVTKGRPNGMPSWGGRIPEAQIWQLAAYIRSLSGGEPSAATSARSDHLESKTAAQLK